MKISAKGRYALGLMLDLAIYDTGEPVALKDVAKRQDIPEKYLEQIVTLMNRAGYVKSVRGAGGGYQLRIAPQKLKISMILEQTEKDLIPNEHDREDIISDRLSNNAVLKVHDSLNDAITGVLSSITLYDMIEWQNTEIDNYSI